MAINKQNGKFFIVGCARSGTTLLQHIIASHSQVVGVNETEILKKFDPKKKSIEKFISQIAESKKECKIVLGHFKKVFKNSSIDELTPYQILDEYCKAHCLYFARPCYVEKSPIHSFFIGGLLSEISQSKIIVVLRDPRALVASKLHANKTNRGLKWHLPKKIRFLLNLSEVLFTYREFEKWYLSLNPRLLFIRYEDVVREPEKTVREIFSFLSLDPEKVYRNLNPLDIRMEARNIKGIWNSSYGPKREKRISADFLSRWKQALTPSQIQFIEECISQMKLRLFKDFYPSLVLRESWRIKPFLMKLFSKLDYQIFLRKNVKSLKYRK